MWQAISWYSQKKPSQGTRRNAMPRKPHDTTAHEPMQASPAPADEWAREVVSRLPEHTQQQARVLKAFERSRQIRSATDLLRGLLASVYTVHSFQQLPHLECLGGSRRCLGDRLAQTPATSQRLAHVAPARSASGLDSGLPPLCCEQGGDASCSSMGPISRAQVLWEWCGGCIPPLICWPVGSPNSK